MQIFVKLYVRREEIEQLEIYNVKVKAEMWFESYLKKNRTQRTRVNKNTSDHDETKFGVPQGTVLGTLLFLIYTKLKLNASKVKHIVIKME